MKKACVKDKILFEGEECPLCKGTDSVTNWKGRVAILNPEKSEIAKKINISKKGEYAIKVK
ncbi:MAG: transcription elongation factor subunit Spt4 [Candidatus Woesearchaeota archaeon]